MVGVGQTLRGKYRVDALVGKGGMASVWQGTHLATGRRIAIKVLDERLLANRQVVERFGREARAASAVQHESIVDVLDLDRTDEGAPFLVMEYLEGETLTERIARDAPLDEEAIAAIADPLLDALHAAHEAGVVHRDLKPDNVMLVRTRRRGELVKVLDFGISSKADEVSSLTATGALLGTPRYMSPEQARGRGDVDRRADVWAAGVVLYECAVGKVPFDAENYNALIQEILNTEPVPPRARGARISAELEALILSALRKDRDARPASAEALREALIEVVGEPLAAASGSFRTTADPSPPDPARLERAQLPTVAATEPARTSQPDTRASQPEGRASQAAARTSQPGRSPLELLPSRPPGPRRKLEIDAAAVRRPSRPTPVPREGTAADTAHWGRLAWRAVLAAIVLVLVVRFVIRPALAWVEARDDTHAAP